MNIEQIHEAIAKMSKPEDIHQVRAMIAKYAEAKGDELNLTVFTMRAQLQCDIERMIMYSERKFDDMRQKRS